MSTVSSTLSASSPRITMFSGAVAPSALFTRPNRSTPWSSFHMRPWMLMLPTTRPMIGILSFSASGMLVCSDEPLVESPQPQARFRRHRHSHAVLGRGIGQLCSDPPALRGRRKTCASPCC